MKRHLIYLLIISGALLGASAEAASNYPERTVAVIVPFPPGGSVDGVARILVDQLNQTMGSHFIVENRAGGASGNVGANVVAKATPDGYTLLLTASLHVVDPFLYKNVPYDVVKDFTPITLIATGPLIVSTNPGVPAGNLKELFELVRNDPQKYTFGTTSIGSASHLVVELLKREAGVDTLVVTYKGTGPAMSDLMGGRSSCLPIRCCLPCRWREPAASRRWRSRASNVSPPHPRSRRSSNPACRGLSSSHGTGFGDQRICRRRSPPRCRPASPMCFARPEVKARLSTLGFEGIGSTPDDFAKFIASEMAKYGKIIEAARHQSPVGFNGARNGLVTIY